MVVLLLLLFARSKKLPASSFVRPYKPDKPTKLTHRHEDMHRDSSQRAHQAISPVSKHPASRARRASIWALLQRLLRSVSHRKDEQVGRAAGSVPGAREHGLVVAPLVLQIHLSISARALRRRRTAWAIANLKRDLRSRVERRALSFFVQTPAIFAQQSLS